MKNTKSNGSSDAVLYPLAFFIPVFLYMAVMLVCRIVPFGSRTLLVWDANGQYSDFLAALRRVLLGRSDPFYTFSAALGSGTAGLASYYLASPWNLLLVLFKETDLPLTYSLLVLVKIGLAGVSMAAYLRHTYRLGYRGLLFAVTYALMGYVAVYGWCVMWMDSVAVLPLVALGLRRIGERKKPFVYIFSLAYALFCNFYIGFMVCLFSVLFAVTLALEDKRALRAAGVFVGSSLLAAGLAGVMLVPAFLAVSGGYSLFSLAGEPVTRVSSLFSILLKAYTGAVSYDQLCYGQPNYYVGIPVLILAAGYFLNSGVPFRKRLVGAILPCVLLVSFIVRPVYLLWHGGDFPNCLPARFSFLFSFVLIDLAVRGYLALPRPAAGSFRRRVVGLCLGMIAFTAIAFRDEIINYLAYETILMDVFVWIATCLILVRPSATRYRRAACALVCAMQVAGLCVNAYMGYHRMSAVADLTVGQYAANIGENSSDLRRLLDSDPESGGLYRIEKNYHYSDNESLSLDYPGLSHYSSAVNTAVSRFADQIGLYHSYLRILYGSGTTPVLDSLLGVKYILFDPDASLEGLPAEYTALWTNGKITAYQNPYALPLAMLVPGMSDAALDSGNPFLTQNAILSDLTGADIRAFVPLEATVTKDDGGFVYAEFPVAAGERIYLSSSGGYYYLNDLPGQDNARFQGCVLLPVSPVDTTYRLKMWSGTGAEPLFAVFHIEELARGYRQLAARAYEVKSDTASHLSLDVTADGQYTQLLLTVPYDRGWSVWVDGRKRETASRYEALLAVNLEPGAHHVEFRYVPAGLVPGAVVSLASLILCILWMLSYRGGGLRLFKPRRRNGTGKETGRL